MDGMDGVQGLSGTDEPEPLPTGGALAPSPRWLQAGFAVLIVVTLLLASALVGSLVPSYESSDRVGGRWYWIVSEGTGFAVKSKTEDRCGVPIFVGLEQSQVQGVLRPVGVHRRIWTQDVNRDLEDPGVRAVVHRAMLASPESAPWAACLYAPQARVFERDWLGTTIFGAAMVIPSAAVLALAATLGMRLTRRALAARARAHELCQACGYSLQGLAPDEAARCPECGTHRAGTSRAPRYASPA